MTPCPCPAETGFLRPLLSALTFALFKSPPDDPAHGANARSEIDLGETDWLDERGPGDRILELQNGDVVRHVVDEVLVNHNTSDQELCGAVVWEGLDSHLHGVVSRVLGSAGPEKRQVASSKAVSDERERRFFLSDRLYLR